MGVLLSIVLFPCTTSADDTITPAAAQFYRENVAPVLAEHCMTCHGPKSKLKAGLFLGSREGLLKGGESGPAVDLDDPAESLLIGAINYGDYEMPPKANRRQLSSPRSASTSSIIRSNSATAHSRRPSDDNDCSWRW